MNNENPATRSYCRNNPSGGEARVCTTAGVSRRLARRFAGDRRRSFPVFSKMINLVLEIKSAQSRAPRRYPFNWSLAASPRSRWLCKSVFSNKYTAGSSVETDLRRRVTRVPSSLTVPSNSRTRPIPHQNYFEIYFQEENNRFGDTSSHPPPPLEYEDPHATVILEKWNFWARIWITFNFQNNIHSSSFRYSTKKVDRLNVSLSCEIYRYF